MKKLLILENGAVFAGTGFGGLGACSGEVVFTTGMTGYQQAITDQSYANQILVFTNPLIGNYGVNLNNMEALQPACAGVICHRVARVSNNWRQSATLPDFLKKWAIPGMTGVDTRALTKLLREHGTLKGKVVDADEEPDVEAVVKELQSTPTQTQLAYQVTTKKRYLVPGNGHTVVLVDLGAKESIVRALVERGCNVIVVPANVTPGEINQIHPDGVLLSNGPGDPASLTGVIAMVKQIQERYPLFGICLGHQVLALANGAKTVKMRFGHRGFNHPVRNLQTKQTFFTSQNHGYVIDAASIDPNQIMVTYQEINDGTIEGIAIKNHPAFSVQFHPDAAPGPHDADQLFDQFIQLMGQQKGVANA
ncbi:carbamoyl phosphate synthase small subunit [Limosilactobacillus sp.]|jgi:carbamoyl-phosphate synthase small subunit|uniref:carbamoyl phosphate synthase small subunit n=1 Tax=Limosilactobacillus sp. TaxID=2773925 RepID=UPI0025BD569A|nr:carbamoyl phosphate synthase small subunit [Limosilactobacillus sp.]MCH3922844.1 carbamoyl phosphate synthase small subunit [Limosilactobacillus sp.]MCH3927527.1 carbamoyl phosphate synthase small subunit [Limosilactobacillus sp.]